MPVLHLPLNQTTLETEGKKLFKKFQKYPDPEKPMWPKYRFTTGGKGYHKEATALNVVIERKINILLEYARKKGARNIIRSRTSKSVYFEFMGFDFRLSDHEQKEFVGVSIIVKWNSSGKNFKDIVDALTFEEPKQ
jgi:hypothetical protein